MNSQISGSVGFRNCGFWFKVYSPLRSIEYGFGYVIIRSPYTPYSIHLRGTIGCRGCAYVVLKAPVLEGLSDLGLGFRLASQKDLASIRVANRDACKPPYTVLRAPPWFVCIDFQMEIVESPKWNRMTRS